MIRIRGAVKAAQTAKDWLSVGIEAIEIDDFRAFVQKSVCTIEHLCQQGAVTPEQLPTRSRNAYHYLKQIDFQNLPLLERSPTKQAVIPPQTATSIQLPFLRQQQSLILETMGNMVRRATPTVKQLDELSATLTDNIRQIERICHQKQARPSDLAPSARNIYAWLKFLSNDRRLVQHLQATHHAQQMALELGSHATQPLKTVAITLQNMSGLYRGQRSRRAAWLHLNEGFIVASPSVLQQVVAIALFDQKTKNQCIHQFVTSQAYGCILLELDSFAETPAEQAQGNTYDLEQLFEQVNQTYFANALQRPRLCWSHGLTYRKFGHYEIARDRVVLSKTLDDANVPEFVVAYVLYHELLHKRHGQIWVDGKRRAHTKAFKQEEKQFHRYEAAEAWLQKISYLTRAKKSLTLSISGDTIVS